MNCPNCQTPNRDGGKFCISCGYSLPQPPPSIPTEPATQPAKQPEPVKLPPVYTLPVSTATEGPFAPARPEPPLPAKYAYLNATSVVLTDVNMPFWSIVRLFVKLAIAAVPALIILALIASLLTAILGILGGGLLGALF